MTLIAQLTDIHLMAEPTQTLRGMNTQTSLTAVLTAIAALAPKPDLLLLTGDLANDGDISAYQRLQTAVSSLAIPAYVLPGNHDLPAVLAEHLPNQFIHYISRLEINGWQILCLDSTVPDQIGGRLSADTLHWLKDTLTQPPHPPTLIAFHHPALPLGSKWLDEMSLENWQEFWQVCAPFPQVKLVVNGHAHQEYDGLYQGVRCLVTPSTCMQFLPKSETFALDPEGSPAFRLLELYPDGSCHTEVRYVSYQEIGTEIAL
ncbi:MAG: phosphodiesterase [Pseudanabaenaceae cyanobacterium]